MEEYDDSVTQVKAQLISKVREYRLNITAFNVFASESQLPEEDTDERKHALAALKRTWDELEPAAKLDFVSRVEAESSVIEFLQRPPEVSSQKSDYKPVNFYAKFIKDRITEE